MPRILSQATVLILIAAGAAGCLSDNGDGPDERPAPIEYYTSDFFPADLDHDHTDPFEHTMKHNTVFIDYHDCTEDGVYHAGTTPGVTDLKEHGDYLYVNQDNGFCILDISNPHNLTFVSHFEAPMGFDIDVSEDGNWVFHATQRNPPPSTQQITQGLGQEDLPRGLYIVDVSDKKNPRFESFYAVPSNGVHTVHYHKHDNGDDIVLLQTYDWAPPSELGLPVGVPGQNAPATQRVEITRLTGLADGTMGLERLAVYALQKPADEPFGDYFPHDCTAQKHPFTNRTYMYCAYWNHGMVIVDITDPSQPTLVSQYNDPTPSQYNNYHYVLASPDLIEGRHITVAAPELQEAQDETGYVRVFDTTDPANPEQLGAWTLPGVPGFGGGFLYSPHQFDIHDGHIYIGHNHGGVWVIDVSNETLLRDPQSAGFYFPVGDEDLDPLDWPPLSQVWVAVEHEGYIYSTARGNGVHVHQYIHHATAGRTP